MLSGIRNGLMLTVQSVAVIFIFFGVDRNNFSGWRYVLILYADISAFLWFVLIMMSALSIMANSTKDARNGRN